ncbi:MAG: RIP metalloprotease RseP [Clostridium sp.]|nr:RIP metalloprotease RseP [Clostridium sp.]MCM1444333.1 RIP metalloprotease RseP [Candidatus Amulumruptor caecigallinarius]
MTIIYFILILGGIVFFHEFGHYLFAKKSGVYIYEFSIGMGPQIFKWIGKKDKITYSIRLFPIGGFVQMAGEEIELDEKIPKDKRMQSKTWFQRFSIMIAGIFFNFILTLVLLFIVGIIDGVPTKTYIYSIDENSSAYDAGLRQNYEIISVNKEDSNSQDMLTLELITSTKEKVNIKYRDSDGNIKEVKFQADKEENNGKTEYKYGFKLASFTEKGFLKSIKYAFLKTLELIKYMCLVIWYLITGSLSVSSLSGPVGIFTMVGETAKAGLINLIYLMAIISANVGFINLLPLPAFDGGRILFLIIEKIKGSPVNPKIENWIHSIGLILLMVLMVFITYNDIINLF